VATKKVMNIIIFGGVHNGKLHDTRQQAKADIFEYIEVFYNWQRRHSYLGYLSPANFEKKFAA